MLAQHIALVAEGEAVNLVELARVSAALQRQVTRDVGPAWGVVATVDAFPRLEDVPLGYWPVLVSSEPLGIEQGVHVDRDGQPYARIELSLAWSLDASRACLEMLVDPFGSRTALGVSPRGDRDAAEVLVEVCAPCAGAAHAYSVNDVIVSDFCTPGYFGGFFNDAPGSRGVRYSWTGAIEKPLQVLPGGHLTWYEIDSDAWWVRSHHGDNPIDVPLGTLRGAGSARALLRERAPQRPPLRSLPLALAAQVHTQRQHTLRSATVRAERLRGLFLESALVPGAIATLASQASDEVTAKGDVASPSATVEMPLDTTPARTVPSAPVAASVPPALPKRVVVRSSLPPSLGGVSASLPPPVPRRNGMWFVAAGALLFGGLIAFLLDGGEPAASASQRVAPVVKKPAAATPAPTIAAPQPMPVPPVVVAAAPPPAPAPAAAAEPVPAPALAAPKVAARKAPPKRLADQPIAPTPVPPAEPAPLLTTPPRPAPALAELLDTRR